MLCGQLAEALLRLALRCVEEDPEARPSMEAILGTQFTGVTGTKLRTLTQQAMEAILGLRTHFLLALLVTKYRH